MNLFVMDPPPFLLSRTWLLFPVLCSGRTKVGPVSGYSIPTEQFSAVHWTPGKSALKYFIPAKEMLRLRNFLIKFFHFMIGLRSTM